MLALRAGSDPGMPKPAPSTWRAAQASAIRVQGLCWPSLIRPGRPGLAADRVAPDAPRAVGDSLLGPALGCALNCAPRRRLPHIRRTPI